MFIAVDVAMLRHPKTSHLRRLLMDRRAALYVIELWAWCSEFAKDGYLTNFSSDAVEEGIGWTLDPGKLFNALVESGWVDKLPDGRVYVHDWDQHQGKWIRQMEAQRNRMRELRGGRRKSDHTDSSESDELCQTIVDGEAQQEFEEALLSHGASTVRAQPSTVMTNQTKPNLTKTENGSCGEVAEPPAPPQPALLVFPTVKGRKSGSATWDLTQRSVDLIASGYPDLDVLQEARKALVWCEANRAERKTADGMLSFLQRWMGKAQNSRASKPQWLLDKEAKERAIAQSEANRRLAASEAAKRKANDPVMCGFHMYSGQDKRFVAEDCNRRCPRYEAVAIGGAQ